MRAAPSAPVPTAAAAARGAWAGVRARGAATDSGQPSKRHKAEHEIMEVGLLFFVWCVCVCVCARARACVRACVRSFASFSWAHCWIAERHRHQTDLQARAQSRGCHA